MNRTLRLVALVALPLLLAAQSPRALAPAAGGLWEVSEGADGHGARRICVAQPAILAQFEHRSGNCTRVVISDEGSSAVIHYTCTNGDFGRSKLTLITPRTIRAETQGISGGLPFNYTFHARRIGECPGR